MLKRPKISEIISGVSTLPPAVCALLDKCARTTHLNKGSVIFGPGKPAENMLLLLSGSIRVQQFCETGRGNVLYRFRAGESCALTTACLLAVEDRPAECVAETDIEAVPVPRHRFEEMMVSSREFRAFVFQSYSERIAELFLAVEEIAFKRLDTHHVQRNGLNGRPSSAFYN